MRAAALVAALVIGCLVVEVVLDGSREGVGSEAGRIAFEEIAGDREGDRSAEERNRDMPEGFEEEVLSMEGKSAVRVGAEGSVVGFSVSQDASAAFSDLSAELVAHGWQPVGSGRGDCGTFLKSEGRFTWLFASCIQVGSGTSVVIQCPVLDEDR